MQPLNIFKEKNYFQHFFLFQQVTLLYFCKSKVVLNKIIVDPQPAHGQDGYSGQEHGQQFKGKLNALHGWYQAERKGMLLLLNRSRI